MAIGITDQKLLSTQHGKVTLQTVKFRQGWQKQQQETLELNNYVTMNANMSMQYM